MHRWIRWGIFIITGTYISCLLVAFLKCIPFNHQWQINPDPGSECKSITVVEDVY